MFTREFLLQLADDLLLNLLPWFQLREWHEDNNSLAALTGIELTGRFEVQLGEWSLKIDVLISIKKTRYISFIQKYVRTSLDPFAGFSRETNSIYCR